MINHARTLLMNRPGDHGYSWDFPGEEFIDPTFIPKQLPVWLKNGWQVLFGTAPDRIYLNYRLRQVMTMLHSTELVEYVEALDPRITYWPLRDNEPFDQIFRVTIDQASGPITSIFTGGSHEVDDGAGQSERQWLVEVLDSQLVAVTQHMPRIVTETVLYTVTDGLSSPITLGSSNLNIRFRETAAGVSWIVHSRARPRADITTRLLTLESTIGGEGIDKLFAATSEPYRTFRNLWEDNNGFGYRSGALLLGIIYYMDGLPQET
jgi:hypothetical protein